MMLPDTATAAASPLSQAARLAVADALEAFRARVKVNAGAAASTADAFTKFWTDLIGTDTAAAGVRSSAHGDQVLLKSYEERAARLASDADAADLVRSIGNELSRPDLTKAAASLTITGAAKDVAGATARDLADVAQTVGGGWLAVLKASPFIVVAGLLFLAWSWLRPRRGSA